jgi:CBS domain-containing protein
MRCEEIMKKDVECAAPTETIQSAAIRMRDENIGFLPVCDESGKVLGTITDRDIAIRVAAEDRPARTTVEQVMTREAVACKPSDDVRDCERLMAQKQKSRMLCLDDRGRLVGVISLSDIAKREQGDRAAETLRQVSAREARP